MRFNAIILAVAAAGVTLSAHPALAAGNVEHVSAPVSYSDLNLSVAAGRHALQTRIAAAASRVCSQHVGQSLAEMNYRRACRADAIEQASARVHALAG